MAKIHPTEAEIFVTWLGSPTASLQIHNFAQEHAIGDHRNPHTYHCETPPKASQIPGNPSRPPTNKYRVHPPQTNTGKGASHIMLPTPPYRAAQFASTLPRGQRGNSQREPTNREELRRLPSLHESQPQPITSSVNYKGWSQAIQIIRPPPREHILQLRTVDTSPNNCTVAIPYRLSFDLISPTQGGRRERNGRKRGFSTEHNTM
jgi:hypothetical protein